MYEVPAPAKAAVDSIINEATQHLQVLLGDHVKAKLIIISEVADINVFKDLVRNEFDVSWAAIQTKSRETKLVEARYAFVYLCKMFTKLSDKETMDLVNRERSSYYNCIEAVESRLFTKDEFFCPKFQSILNQLNFENEPETV